MHRSIAAARHFLRAVSTVALVLGSLAHPALAEEPALPKPISVKTPTEGSFLPDDAIDQAVEAASIKAAKPKLVPRANGTVNVGKVWFSVLWTAPGKIAAKRPGEYDKARDFRRPDRFVWLDIATGKIVAEHEIEDPTGLLRIGQLHAEHPGLGTFVHMPADGKWLRVVDGEVEWEVAVERPLAKYDPESLKFQRVDDIRVLMSLSVDPVNKDAVARQKADRDDVDFYLIDLAAKKAARVLTIEGQNRPTAWRWGKDKLALLRKSKNFSTGGVALEVYALPLSSAK